LVSKMQKILPNVTYKDLVKLETIANIANLTRNNTIRPDIPWPTSNSDVAPASFVQGQYFDSWAGGENNNVMINLRIDDLNIAVLRAVYNQIVRSFSTFRTLFKTSKDELNQVVVSSVVEAFCEVATPAILIAEQQYRFDLKWRKAVKKHRPLLRFAVHEDNVQIVSHHIAVDTIGLVILEKAILSTYRELINDPSFVLKVEEHTPVQYGLFEQEILGWTRQFWESQPVAEDWLPRPECSIGTEANGVAKFYMMEIPKKTDFTTCLAAFDRAVRTIGQPCENIAIATLFHGRWRVELQEMLSCLVQTSAFIIPPKCTYDKLDTIVNSTIEHSIESPWRVLENLPNELLFASEDGFDFSNIEGDDNDNEIAATNRILCLFVSGLRTDKLFVKIKYDTGVFSEENAIEFGEEFHKQLMQ